SSRSSRATCRKRAASISARRRISWTLRIACGERCGPGTAMTNDRVVDRILPVAAVLGLVVILWYGAAILLNGPQIRERLDNLGAPWSSSDFVAAAWSMGGPGLPGPHQIAAHFYDSVFDTAIDSKRSLVYHANVTISATICGFLLGSLLGIALAIGIVHLPVLDR